MFFFSLKGQKFPRSLEISLSGSLAFGPVSQQQSVDPICTGDTAYIKVSYVLYISFFFSYSDPGSSTFWNKRRTNGADRTLFHAAGWHFHFLSDGSQLVLVGRHLWEFLLK